MKVNYLNNKDLLEETELTTDCFWKGTANYYNLVDGEEKAVNSAWYYANPKEGAEDKVKHNFTNYVAFYPSSVQVS